MLCNSEVYAQQQQLFISNSFIRDDSLRHVLGLKGDCKNCSLIYDLYVIRMKRG